jgi:hypothetical protein
VVNARSWRLAIVNGVPTFAISTDGVNDTTIGGGTIEANTWTHIAATRSGETVTLFLNSESVGSATIAGALFDGAGPLLVGATDDDANPNCFRGVIDELRVSATSRSSSLNAVEVAYTYNARNQLSTETCGASDKTRTGT